MVLHKRILRKKIDRIIRFAQTDFTITVLESTDITVFEIPELCKTNDPINLFDYVEPKTGSFSGTTLAGGQYFDPSIYGGGKFSVVYTVKNGLCYDEKELFITVNAVEDIVFEGLPYSICNASTPVDLMDYVYPKTGTFSNEEGAIINNILYPTLLNNGLHTIVYTINNPSGCDQVVEKKLYILEEPAASLNINSEVCQSEKPFRFTGGQPIGGKYFVDGKEVILFDPSEYSTGLHTVEYKFINAMGCETVAASHINIKAAARVSLQTPDRLCDNGNAITLKGGYPFGGQYFVNGEAVSTFDPSIYGAGDYVLEYRYESNGCVASAEQPLEVAQTEPVTIFEIPAICNNAVPVELTAGSPVGGYYTINGKVAEILDPSKLNPGLNTLTYNLENNGCTSQASTQFEVLKSENFTVSKPVGICENDNILPLNVVSPTGGTYTGSGVINNQLDPSAIGEGTFYYEYHYKSENGCESVIPFTLVVNPAPDITMPELTQICTNDEPFTLSASPAGGEFTGAGVVNGIIYPKLSTAGIQNITYSVENKFGCKASKQLSFIINEPKKLIIEDVAPICQNGDPVFLNFVTPTGGDYSGPGVTDNILYPDKTSAGVKNITYSYVDRNGCNTETDFKVTIKEKPDIQEFYLDNICSNDNPISLETNGFYSKSIYMGKGVSNNEFDPEAAGAGEARIRYLIVDQAGCSNYSEKTVNVKEAPYVFLQSTYVCQDAEQVELELGYPKGGNYQGDFVVGNKFLPFSPGVFDLSYSYTANNGCSAKAQNYLTVNEYPTITFRQISDICVNSEPFELTGGQPSGGKYYLGDEEEEDITWFDPAEHGVGTYTIRYKLANKAGCEGEVETTFQVMETEEVHLVGLEDSYCKNAAPVTLADKAYPTGGRFLINETMAYELNPAKLPDGVNKITYVYDSKQGCTVTTSKEIRVNEVPEVPEVEMKKMFCPGEELSVEPTNYKSDYQIMVRTTSEGPGHKADYGDIVFKADHINYLDICYTNEAGCESDHKSFEIKVESKDLKISTAKRNVEKGEPLQFKIENDYDDVSSFEWQFSDGGVSYEAEPFHYFNLPGYVSVELKYCTEVGCNFTKKLNNYIYVVNSDGLSTDVTELEEELNFKLFPNPANDKVNVYLDYTGKYSLRIFNNLGVMVSDLPKQSGNSMVALNSFLPGTYLVKVTLDNGATINKMLIIQ